MRRVEAGGAQIAYDDLGTGAGPALLLLPGWCVNRGFFAPLAERLAASRRVLALDWRGNGESGAAAAEMGHAELVEDALRVIEASGAEAVIPVGQAHGAWVAIDLRRQLGARIPAIVAASWLVLDPPPPFTAVLDAL
jgi:pimeloyl-ACP methyl ester carboxylesterase